MSLKVLGISASPRENGNSDLLLAEALAGAESSGAEVEYLTLRGLTIAPCSECNACYRTGACRFEDDFQAVQSKMIEADRLIFATPIFFMSVCAQAKLLIDRCQCLWAKKYLLKEPLFPPGKRDRRAAVIAVGGSSLKSMFDCVRLTLKYYFDALEFVYTDNLFVNKVDEAGAIRQRPEVLADARLLGRNLVEGSV